MLKECFSGNRDAWQRFVETYSKLVYYSIHQTCKIRGISPDSHEVDDLYGSVFLALFEDNFARLRSFKGKNDCSLASWIRLISSRKTLDHLREKARRSRLIDYTVASAAEEIASAQDTELDTIEAERAELARKAMLRLNADEVAFMHLYYERELPPEKVADILGVTVSTVYSKKNRIREKIKRIIEKKKGL